MKCLPSLASATTAFTISDMHVACRPVRDGLDTSLDEPHDGLGMCSALRKARSSFVGPSNWRQSLSVSRVGDLEIDQSVAEQERSWSAQRISWIVLALVLVAGILGVMGHGWLANASTGSAETALTVDYERFARHSSPATLQLMIASDATDGETVDVSFNLDWVSDVTIESIVPEPESASSTGSVVTYAFTPSSPGNPMRIVIRYQPAGIGPVEVSIAVDDREPVTFSQFIYP
jgi:hypothetical protein